ncbi:MULTISPECIES: RecQ family ATP-dependent DNA helicase [unclassified Virgibacillus]|uniref:RecQ family ATP-dependent DNA helicase n=1 Tax=unclassified Virgibacillus TaxID=2620237 RepID=UPI0024DE9CA4|nr:RecQ family ATP-dependent DNA helicase [Virgibacillus sp. LDC-1]
MVSNKQLEVHLERIFGYHSFRPGQREIIEDVMKGEHVLGVLPTGTGKSICYQLPAMLLSGTTVVVSPLISLMMDQVKQLKATNFKKVVAINSFLDSKQRNEIYRQLHEYKLIYVSPELLQQDAFMHRLDKLHISLFVIDEAHCISQWGHEFRPDYLRLKDVIKTLAYPPVLALSATATPKVQKDIMKALDVGEMKKHINPIDRENIILTIRKVTNKQEKLEEIDGLLKKYNVPTLIYFSSRHACENIAQLLSGKWQDRRIAFYHGGMEQLDRVIVQQQFMNNQLDIICCTSAFGMGINKSNIRLVIHYHFPAEMEAYIQEVGRAGRDGLSSLSVLLFAANDLYLPKQIVENELPSSASIHQSFEVLSHLANKGQPLPINQKEIGQLFSLTETQWNFLQYQFEKHGIIKERKINFNENKWQHAFSTIQLYRDERLIQKEAKLMEMVKWIQCTSCLREELFIQFQDAFTKPNNHCCSNCGFVLDDWTPIESKSSLKKDAESWQTKLESLLLLGDKK